MSAPAWTNRQVLASFADFTSKGSGMRMRSYQLAPAEAVLESIRRGLGLDFVVMMPRQSGKDELLAQLTAFLMSRLSARERGIVMVNPTYKPQTINAILRLENRLKQNQVTCLRWSKRADFMRLLGKCRTAFYSGDGQANVVGATADLCLIINEAQDIDPAVYFRNFAPMAASRAATRLFCGTAWTSTTLLAQMQRVCLAAQEQDGMQRVFLYTADDVRREVPRYGRHVDGEVLRLGREHPFIKTQYFCEQIDASAGMFPPGRQALMHGSHPSRLEPEPGRLYCFLVDVAGQDECPVRLPAETACASTAGTGGPAEDRAASPWDMSLRQSDLMLNNPSRDSSFLKIVEVDLSSLPVLGRPTYRVMGRQGWTGARHVDVFGALKALAALWHPRYLLIDATGVGEGLWSMLDNALGPKVVRPVKFTPALKSELGYGLLGIIESGRYQEYHPFDETFRLQLDHAVSEIVPGPARLMRWGVPDGRRGPDGRPVHDDDLVTSAMCTLLDRLEWHVPTPLMIVQGRDPLPDMDRNY